MANLPPAGWYADPDDGAQQRYWDGSRWTEHRAPAFQPVTAQQGPDPSGPEDDRLNEPSAVRQPDQVAGPEQAGVSGKVPLFGARKHAHQAAEELERLRSEMQRLGVLDVSELQRERD
jgi:hypothetical protein